MKSDPFYVGTQGPQKGQELQLLDLQGNYPHNRMLSSLWVPQAPALSHPYGSGLMPDAILPKHLYRLKDCHTAGNSTLWHFQKMNGLFKVTCRRRPAPPYTLGNRSCTHICEQRPSAGGSMQKATLREGRAKPMRCPGDSVLAKSVWERTGILTLRKICPESLGCHSDSQLSLSCMALSCCAIRWGLGVLLPHQLFGLQARLCGKAQNHGLLSQQLSAPEGVPRLYFLWKPWDEQHLAVMLELLGSEPGQLSLPIPRKPLKRRQ